MRWPWLAGLLLGIVAWGAAAHAGMLIARDGGVVRGHTRLESGRVVVRSPGGWVQASVALDQVQEAVFDEPSPAPATTTTTAPGDEEVESPETESAPELAATRPGDLRGLMLEVFRIESPGSRKTLSLADAKFETPIYSRLVPQINWDGAATLDPQIKGSIALRFSGFLVVPETRNYRLTLSTGSGLRLIVDGKPLENRAEPKKPHEFSVDLEANRRHSIVVETVSGTWGRKCRLMWAEGKSKYRTIPSAMFRPPGDPPNMPPRISLPVMDPRGYASPPALMIRPVVNDPDGKIAKVVYLLGGMHDREVIGESTAPPFGFEWKSPPPGLHMLTAQAVDDRGLGADSNAIEVAILGGGLAAPWGAVTFGKMSNPRVELTVSPEGECRIELKGNGAEFWTGSGYSQVVRSMSGDGEVIGQLTEATSASGLSFTGLIVTSDPGTDSRWIAIGASPEAGATVARRIGSKYVKAEPIGQARGLGWYRITRHGGRIRAYASDDGKDWRLQGRWLMELPEVIWMGVVFAPVGPPQASARFEHVAVIEGAAEVVADAGLRLTDGSFIAGELLSIKGGSVSLKRPSGQTISVARDAVASIVLREMTAELAGQAPDAATQGILTTAGDFLTGEVVEMTYGKIHSQSIIFGTQSFRASEVAVIQLAPRAEAKKPGPYAVELLDGSTLVGSFASTDPLSWRTTAGVELALTPQAIRRLRRL